MSNGPDNSEEWFEPDDDDFSIEDFDEARLPAVDREVMFGIAFCNFIVNKLQDDFGEEAVLDLLFAIDRNMGWASEILANRYDVDNILLDRYGAFDQHIWYKVQDTKAWAKMHRQVYKMTRRYLAAAVDEVVQAELLDTQ
jgi:hypothetical protein